MTKGISAVKVSSLYVSAVDAKPFDFDFSEGYTEKWDVLQPENAEPGDENWQEPMMNTWWPLPDFSPSEDDAKNLAGSPFAMCIVQNLETDEYGLALTGGGMNMSWDIAGAYILLGYLPPVHLRLPRFAGKRLTPTARVTLAAMGKSYRVMVNWMQSNLRDLKGVREYMKA